MKLHNEMLDDLNTSLNIIMVTKRKDKMGDAYNTH